MAKRIAKERKGRQRKCPRCRLVMPLDETAVYKGYYHCTPECWQVFSEVIGYEFCNAIVFSQAHQLTVDTYAVQHAGGRHPDKSIAIHLVGLHAAFNLKIHSMLIPGLLQRLASCHHVWPHFSPPASTGPMNIFDIGLASTADEHIMRVRRWAAFVWDAWSDHHEQIADLADAIN